MLVLKYKKLSALYVLFAIVYLLQSILTKPDQATLDKYHISIARAVALTLTIAIPYLIIWFVALIGYLRFRCYSDSIAGSKDGKAFKLMEKGLLLLTLWLPLSAILANVITKYYHAHPDATSLMVNINNYGNLLMLLPAFYLLNAGASKLLPLIRRKRQGLPVSWVLIGVCLVAAYVFLVFHDPARSAPTKDVPVASYYLPDWAILFTLIIPRLVMWFLGIQAVFSLFLYKDKIKGSIYKSALNYLARGIGWVVLTTIVLRCFQSLSGPLSRLSIGMLLLVIYVLLIIVAIGYVWIAKGARSLLRIEKL